MADVEQAAGIKVGDSVLFPYLTEQMRGTVTYIELDEKSDQGFVGISFDDGKSSARVPLASVIKVTVSQGLEAQGIPVILKCIKGEEWPLTSYITHVSFKEDVQSHDTITFICPLYHQFTLKRAVKAKILTPELAVKIILLAQQQLPDLRKSARRCTAKFTRTSRKSKK
jgi:hypothetical protein